MNVTTSNANQEFEQICVRCGSLFRATNGKHKYCSGTCRTANHRMEKTEKLIEKEKVFQQHEVELNELKSAPVSRTQYVREVNPVWQQANHEYQAQQAHCQDLLQQMAFLQQTMNRQTKSGRGAYIGAGAGVASVLVWMAIRYDARQRKPLGVTFAVMAFILLITYGLIGYWAGQEVDQQIQSNDKEAASQLSEWRVSYCNLEKQLTVNRKHLEKLRIALSKVSKYERETVTSIDEIRTTAANLL